MTIRAERECKAQKYCIDGIIWDDGRLRYDLSRNICRFSDYRDLSCSLRDKDLKKANQKKSVHRWWWMGSRLGEAGEGAVDVIEIKVKNRYFKGGTNERK